ncbi:EF-hand domain-containing protein [Acidovorax sp. NCPPB 3576]|uniref:EF-hand domain-containing protein n=1 Tax=Acidovorax sp. NCPPB 3576 TaxID=2940488 RepID=UPI00234A6B70|nr:EF-hand domain-containing protein [Acidovorax sp. NCPPB 3576]WCM89280.1 EF-hand domain-containing protein [Acidovorax sp. NCPPB 3576]
MNAPAAPLSPRSPGRAIATPARPSQATALRAIALFSLLAIGLAFSAVAATPPAAAASAPQAKASAPLSKGEIKAQKEFKMLDFNGDGKLSRSEVALFPRLANAFDDADTNHDGFVSYDEVQAFAVKYRAERDRARAEAAKTPASAAKP